MGKIDENKLRQYAPKTSSLIFAGGKTKKGKKTSTVKTKKDVKFSLPHKKQFRKLLSTYEKEIKAGKMLLIFANGHWRVISSKEPALKKLANAIQYSFSKDYDKDVTKFATLAPYYMYKSYKGEKNEWDIVKDPHDLNLANAGVITGGALYSLTLSGISMPILGSELAISEGILQGPTVLVGISSGLTGFWTSSISACIIGGGLQDWFNGE